MQASQYASYNGWEWLCVGVAVCGSCCVWGLQGLGLQCGSLGVWELRCVGVAVCGGHCAKALQFVEVAVHGSLYMHWFNFYLVFNIISFYHICHWNCATAKPLILF